MKIDTTVYGPQEIDSNSVIEFPKGIPGFEQFKKFKLFHHDENPDLFWLQSTEEPDVAFSAMDPEKLAVYFEFTLTEDDLKDLETNNPEDIALLVMIYEPVDTSEEALKVEKEEHTPYINANVRGPLVFNAGKSKGIQKVIQNFYQKTTISEMG